MTRGPYDPLDMKLSRTLPLLATTAVLVALACSQPGSKGEASVEEAETKPTTAEVPEVMDEPEEIEEIAEEPTAQPGTTTEVATFGAGCFWCVEAVLEQLDGVENVVSGYMGGEVDNPTYKEVCEGTTGHAEVVQVTFDPKVISYRDLVEWFWKLHDPTTLNRQGNDVGTQYRSAIYYHSEEQKKVAEESKAAADESGKHIRPIVTEITAADTFYVAEGYHQDYYRGNKEAGYCRYVITPKLDKLGLEK